MQDIWKLEKHCLWSGIVYSDHNGITSGDLYMGSKRSNSDYLSVFRTVCYLANFVDSLLKRKVQLVRRAFWYPLYSTDPNNISQI